ncbi:HpcH/HpaI aldolase family protein [Delftia sp. PS-11]|uniref:HpcH/HpaI aldolase family protein n=1 Tax=Delftia sp. PS-11 TaxID=2767222 RepID=UPI0024566935|nr:aldolase/citrate lyase family protein [Delftia sp. PS-11]KAJ8740710.1 4-hydroxy-2-oxovalerate aldolase [Delftia sp. PS-11]
MTSLTHSLFEAERDFTHNLWLSTPNYIAAEIAADLGFSRVLYDIEHGPFDLTKMFEYFAFCKALGLQIYAKVLAPERSAVQSALDFGADAVLIPHVQSAADAERVCAFAKYPPLGDRSVSSGRVTRYQSGSTQFYAEQNCATRCIPVIETAGALDDIDAIAALPCVDAIFVGPTDLALRRGRGAYRFCEESTSDVLRCVRAAKAAGKPWIFPAWTSLELGLARKHGAEFCFCINEFRVLRQGMEAATARFSAARS